MGIWRFPEIWVPLSHLFEIGIFHERNHPAIGVPTFMESSIYIYIIHINYVMTSRKMMVFDFKDNPEMALLYTKKTSQIVRTCKHQ